MNITRKLLQIHTRMPSAAASIKITPGRLIDTIHETAKWGAKGVWGTKSTETGVCRLALSDLDKNVRDWLIEETQKLGCKVKVDELGNIFSVFPGKNKGLPTAMGSHLDTQPTGGRYDGILGVLTGLEVLRTLKDNDIVPNYPIALIDWTNEEGARFPKSVMSLGVWAGLASLEDTYNLMSVTDDVPVSVKHELERIGYLGEVKASHEENAIAAHFEIHIEQGPVLEMENKKIGIVTGGQAYSWFKVKVSGKAQHTGTTPLKARSDALLAASKMMVKGNEIAAKYNGLLSVGILTLEPAVVNVIPEDVSFTLDIRHVEDEFLSKICEEAKAEFTKIAAGEPGKRCSVEIEHLQTSPAVKFNQECISCVRDTAIGLFGEFQVREIVSGAGHDSCATSAVVPTSMIFIPSKDGVSHNPEEYSTPEQVHEGLQVLLGAVLEYDSRRTS